MKRTNVCTIVPDGRTNWIHASDLGKKDTIEQTYVCTIVPDGRTNWIDGSDRSIDRSNKRMYNECRLK